MFNIYQTLIRCSLSSILICIDNEIIYRSQQLSQTITNIMWSANLNFSVAILKKQKTGDINFNIFISPRISKIPLQHIFNIKILILHSSLDTKSLKSSGYFTFKAYLEFGPASFQVLGSHMWLVAAALD